MAVTGSSMFMVPPWSSSQQEVTIIRCKIGIVVVTEQTSINQLLLQSPQTCSLYDLYSYSYDTSSQNNILLAIDNLEFVVWHIKYFFKWANPGLFLVYFRSFQTNIITNFTTNICEKMSIIRCRGSNPRPSERESLPITTRPGPIKYLRLGEAI